MIKIQVHRSLIGHKAEYLEQAASGSPVRAIDVVKKVILYEHAFHILADIRIVGREYIEPA